MAIKTYRVYFSGKMSSRHSNYILHRMLEAIGFSGGEESGTGSDRIPTVRNLHRGNEETYFDVDIPVDNLIGQDPESILDSIRRYVIDNSVQYDDITTEPPKIYQIDG